MRNFHRPHHGEKGQVALEAAFAAVFFLLLVIGGIELTWASYQTQLLRHAAQKGLNEALNNTNFSEDEIESLAGAIAARMGVSNAETRASLDSGLVSVTLTKPVVFTSLGGVTKNIRVSISASRLHSRKTIENESVKLYREALLRNLNPF